MVDDWERWKREKNKVNIMLSNEARRNDGIEQMVAEKDITSRQLWIRFKKLAGWMKSLSLTKFTTENGLVTKPV